MSAPMAISAAGLHPAQAWGVGTKALERQEMGSPRLDTASVAGLWTLAGTDLWQLELPVSVAIRAGEKMGADPKRPLCYGASAQTLALPPLSLLIN